MEGQGFTEAKNLNAGDEVRLESGKPATIDSTETIKLDEPIKVYNFEVEDFHTYYVSEQTVLVHNTCAVTVKNVSVHTGKSGKTKYVVGSYKDVKAVKKIQNIEGMDVHHVGQGAGMKKMVENYDYETAPAISVFSEGHTIKLKGKGIVSRNIKGITSPRQLLARDIRELRRVYPDIPNSAYRSLIKMNKKEYSEMR